MSATTAAGPTAPVTVTGAFLAKLNALASVFGADGRSVQALLGAATANVQTVVAGTQRVAVQQFEGGILSGIEGGPVFAVSGSIYAHYKTLGAVGGVLGGPVTDEQATADGGRVSRFAAGAIYWSGKTGSFSVRGSIYGKYKQLGEASGPLGFPITDETGTPDGVGRFNHFQAGSIYWTPQTGGNAVFGAIRQRWSETGWERGPLGYPTTDETGTPDKIGRFNHFQHGSVYWTPETGAHEVLGAIRDRWAASGWERGPLGYPTAPQGTNRDRRHGGVFNRFQNGHISSTNASGPSTSLAGTVYEFRIDAFDIASLRSSHRDSDYVTLGVTVDGVGNTPTTVNMGDVATGTHTLDLAVRVTVPNPDSAVAVTYSIINSGHANDQQLGDTIKQAMTQLEQAANIPASGDDPNAQIGGDFTQAVQGDTSSSFWEKTGADILTAGLALLFADCDGPVAGLSTPSGGVMFTGASLNDLTSVHQTVTYMTSFPGTNSPSGCGANSLYNVHWSVSRIA